MTKTVVRRIGLGAATVVVGFAATTGVGAAAPHATKHSQHRSGHASAAPGSGLGAIEVNGTATAIRVPFYSHQGEDVEAEVPYANVTLSSGGIGQALASVMWPGPTGAHGGDILSLLNVSAVPPSVAQKLNDPEKAEAQTGVGNPTVTQNQPGVDQSATAKPTLVTASAGSSANAVPAIGQAFGKSHATTTIKVTGPKTVVSTAESSVRDLTIAKVVKIGSVRSVATAVSRGRTGRGTAHTYVSDVTVAGIRVAVDASGVHVTQKQPGKKGGGGLLPVKLPTLPSLDSIVNKALKQAGISIATTKSTRKVKRAHVLLDSGALVISENNSGYTSGDNDTSHALIIGGVTLDANTTPGFPPPPPISPPVAPTGSGTTTNTAGTPGTPGIPGTPGTAGTSLPGGSAPDVAGQPTGGPQQAALAAASYKLFGGLPVWEIVLAALASGFVAFGLKRLPDRVLEAPGAACPLEETP